MAVSIDTVNPDEVQDERISSEASFLTDEVFDELKNQTDSCLLCELEDELENDDWE